MLGTLFRNDAMRKKEVFLEWKQHVKEIVDLRTQQHEQHERAQARALGVDDKGRFLLLKHEEKAQRKGFGVW